MPLKNKPTHHCESLSLSFRFQTFNTVLVLLTKCNQNIFYIVKFKSYLRKFTSSIFKLQFPRILIGNFRRR